MRRGGDWKRGRTECFGLAGAPLMVVGRNLGHADTRMVERHYGHLAPSYIADAIRAAAPKFGIEPDRKVALIEDRA